MTISWVPVELTDSIGSILALYLAVACLIQARLWFKNKHDDIFRHYIILLTTAITIFAASRSIGHLVKQVLLLSGQNHIWQHLSPFSGGINTATFIAICTIGIYYQSVEKIHRQIEYYHHHLEDMVTRRTAALEDEITERKQIQQSLSEEKEQLAVTLRSIGDGVITTDTAGQVVLINKVAEQLTVWRHEEAAGRSIIDIFKIVDAHDRTPLENPVTRVLSLSRIVAMANNTVLIAKDGAEYNIADSGAPIYGQDSNIIGVVLVFRDVTAEKRLHAEMMKNEKLESVGVLAGGIAHDFNNILMAIMGNLSLTRHILDSQDRVYPLIKAAEKAAIRAKDLAQQLLTFSRGGDPVRQTAAIGEVIRESADFALHGSQIKCQYRIPDDLWLVHIDKGQMSQVIQNLIINARQAMDDSGSISISCENITDLAAEKFPPLAADRKYIKISTTDSGPGIPAKSIAKIFDPYFTTKEMGNGLGLAITNSIIAKHEGFIRVASSPEETVFTIYLPVAEPRSNGQAGAQSTLPCYPDATAHGKILVMDDEEMIRQVTYTMLRLLGYQVVLAADGRKALKLYLEASQTDAPIDAMIMDLTVPGGMGGKEAAAEALRLDPAAKILVSSGYSNDPIITNYRQYGFCGSLIKPYKIMDLHKALTAIITPQSAATPN
ncbi:MAG: response regulator [Deltaproteobacteria bacterium]|nr:response regulator [Deltaproteobacteria bacterium]